MGTALSETGTVAVDLPPEAGERTTGSAVAKPFLRHPLWVGLGAAALAGVTLAVYPAGADGAISAFLAAVLVVLAATDLERRIIPNRVVLPAAAIVLLSRIGFFPSRTPEFALAAFGAAVAFLVPNLLNPSWMGIGDVKLALLVGAGLGWGVVGAVAIAFLVTFPFALGTIIRGARKATLPFGPFLAFGAVVILLLPHVLGLSGT